MLLSVDASAALHVWGAKRARAEPLAVEDSPPPVSAAVPPPAPTAPAAAAAAAPAAPARSAEHRDERPAAFVSDDDSASDDGSPFVDAAAQAAYDDIMTPGKLVRSHSASSSPRDPDGALRSAAARGGGVAEAKEATASPVSVEFVSAPSSSSTRGGGASDAGAAADAAADARSDAGADADVGNRVLRMEEDLARRLHQRDAYGGGDLQTRDDDVHADVPPMPHSLTSSGLLGYDGGATCFGGAAHPMQGGAWARNLVWHPERAMLAYCSAGVRCGLPSPFAPRRRSDGGAPSRQLWR